MPRVVPSQVVIVIDGAFPHARTGTQLNYDPSHASRLRGIVALAKKVPAELVTGASDYCDLILCIAVVEEQLRRWLAQSGGVGSPGGFGKHVQDPVVRLRQILADCRDDPLPQDPSFLSFINDQDLRDSILRDIRAADDALSHSEWKAATVLAGAAIEALLHWYLERVAKVVS